MVGELLPWFFHPAKVVIKLLSPTVSLALSAEWFVAIAGLITAVAAAYAAWNGVRILEHQRNVDDVKLSYEILKEVSTYWDEMLIDDKNRKFYIGQILMNFEYAASLFNRNTLSEEASEILSLYMIDTMNGFANDIDAEIFIKKLNSEDENLSQLSVFLRRNQAN
jgi:hypothetical protein